MSVIALMGVLIIVFFRWVDRKGYETSVLKPAEKAREEHYKRKDEWISKVTDSTLEQKIRYIKIPRSEVFELLKPLIAESPLFEAYKDGYSLFNSLPQDYAVAVGMLAYGKIPEMWALLAITPMHGVRGMIPDEVRRFNRNFFVWYVEALSKMGINTEIYTQGYSSNIIPDVEDLKNVKDVEELVFTDCFFHQTVIWV